MSNVLLAQGSGNPAYDASALRAVEHVGQLPPPPARSVSEFREFVIEFHSEASGGQPRPPQQSDVQAWRRFFDSNPTLKDRELCAIKIATFGGAQTWDDLSLQSARRCFPASRWQLAGRSQGGVNYYVDLGTITLREQGQVDVWILNDWPITNPQEQTENPFLSDMERALFDCDARMMRIVFDYLTDVEGNTTTAPPSSSAWQGVPPGTVLEYLMDTVCEYRARVRSEASAPKQEFNVQPKTVVKLRPPTQEELQNALKIYLEHRQAF